MIEREAALANLRTAMDNPMAAFREGQWEAIDAIVNQRGRVLCIQRTGWGKSMVYFVSAKLLRTQGAGPTIIVSPLLALMRNQVEAAERLGLRAATVNSTNNADWLSIRKQLLAGEVDLLLISPERLANDDFVLNTLQPIAGSVALLVVDEAHCISDWGHDFRPDYRRIGQILSRLQGKVAVLATTATANTRVQQDVAAQLGGAQVTIQRGALVRESLQLQTLPALGAAERLAWLAGIIPRLGGSGIVYALTQRDAERVSDWLRQNAIDAHAYHAGIDDVARQDLERRLLSNDVACLVATTALGMGYDKPDLKFVIHYQMPGNVVAYYQQVGRAGRAIPEAYGVLMSGEEDDQINAYFRETAFPPQWQMDAILGALEDAEDGLSVQSLEHAVNLRRSHIEKVLKLLVVEPQPPVTRVDGKWSRTPHPFRMDKARIDHLTRQRELEWQQMGRYLRGDACLMHFLANALDDPMAASCGKCAVCKKGPVLPTTIDSQLLLAAQRFMRHGEIPFELKKQWPQQYREMQGVEKARIPEDWRGEPGLALSRWGEPVLGALVASGKGLGRFDDDLVNAAAETISQRWEGAAGIDWVTCIPSRRHPDLVPGFARRLAEALCVPFHGVIEKVRDTEPQKTMENGSHQCANLHDAFRIADGVVLRGNALLVDDVVDSAWTLTIATVLLRQSGAASVFPFALAMSAAT